MFEFYGYWIAVVRLEAGLLVCLHQDEHDPEPVEYRSRNQDPYCAAALLRNELDLQSESEIIQLGELLDAHL